MNARHSNAAIDGVESRSLALEILRRVEDDGAYANLALSAGLNESGLSQPDRSFVTDLVYGTVRMQRAIDYEIDHFVKSPPPPAARRALRLGVYQLRYRDDLPDYAVVSSTVESAPKRFRGLLNAVLRKVSRTEPRFANLATELSYPDWILSTLSEDLGAEVAVAALKSMNEPAKVHKRADGYVQDLASQMVVDAIPTDAGQLILDVCAAPGGKTTGMAASAGFVVGGDIHVQRARLIEENSERLGIDNLASVAMDATAPPFRAGCADAVLVDAPCTGLGVLRRRADARWRVQKNQIARLALLQNNILSAAVDLLKPGGSLIYSVCTLTEAETLGVDQVLQREHSELVPMEQLGSPWEAWGRGSILYPTIDHDGMALFRYEKQR